MATGHQRRGKLDGVGGGEGQMCGCDGPYPHAVGLYKQPEPPWLPPPCSEHQSVCGGVAEEKQRSGFFVSLPTSKMSCCGGNCGCGSSCQCGNGCGGCKMFADFGSEEMITTTQTLVLGFAPAKGSFEGFEMVAGAAENDCKCGSNCSCTGCNCGK